MRFLRINSVAGATLVVLFLTVVAAIGARCQSPQSTPVLTPKIVEDKDAPEGWSRYEFTYDGGEVLSVIMPKTPPLEFLPRESPIQYSVEFSGLLLGVDERHVTARLEGLQFIVYYFSGLSVPTEQFTEDQKEHFGALTLQRVGLLEKGFSPVQLRSTFNGGKMRSIRVNDNEGFEQDFLFGVSSSPYHCHARAVFAGRYSYVVAVVGKEDLKEEQYTPFFNSFRLVKN
ncbi:MAG: hypothetical protein LAO21_19495 [Acidobacteriia bacterium]|nr:hypothetical protein [Terriglobia bacterium]